MFGKKPIYIKPARYGKAARGGVVWLKWIFDHGGFGFYLLAATIIVLASGNRPAAINNNTDNIDTITESIAEGNIDLTSPDATDNYTDNYTSNATGGQTDAIAFLPGVMIFSQNLTSNIGQGGSYLVDALGNLIYANEQNKKLRQDLNNYNLLKQEILVLQRENIELSRLLKFEPTASSGQYVTARIVGDGGASGRQTWLINKGANNGVTRGAFAVDDQGLVGVVTEVAQGSARILRLSDPNFYLPVTVSNRQFRAVLRGNGSPIATLDYFEGLEKPAVGDVVVSTGSGGNFPPFMPIGTIYDKQFGDLGVLIFTERKPPIYVKIYKP